MGRSAVARRWALFFATLVALGELHALHVRAQEASGGILCNDTTTPRPPDSTCPPNTQGALGLSGFIESSTIQSCSQFSNSELDCGDGNATVIVLGLIPGQEAPILNLEVITHHETRLEEGAQCTATDDGRCVTIEPIQLRVRASDSVLAWTLQDTNVENYYAYTHAFSGATSQQTKEEKDLEDDDCGRVENYDSEIADQSEADFFSQTCVSFMTQIPQPGDPISDRWTGVTMYPDVVNCARDLSTKGTYDNQLRRFDIPEYCSVPYPKEQRDKTLAAFLKLDPLTGLNASEVANSYGRYRFPSFQQTCVQSAPTPSSENARDVCYKKCDDTERSSANQESFDAQWDFYDADPTTPTCATRCKKKFGVLTDKQPCRMWAGNYATQVPMQGSEVRLPSNVIVPEKLKAALSDYYSRDENGIVRTDRAAVISNTLQSSTGQFNYATYLGTKRPICPGCPGPYGPWKHYLLPRKYNTQKGVYEGDNVPPPTGVNTFPHHTQCYEDDDSCCDAFVKQKLTTGKEGVPRAECKYSRLANDVCPLRRGVIDRSAYGKNELDESFFEGQSIDTSTLLPPYLNSDSFGVVVNGFLKAGTDLCNVFIDSADKCDFYGPYLAQNIVEDISIGVTSNRWINAGIIAGFSIVTAIIPFSTAIAVAVTRTAKALYGFFTTLKTNNYYVTTASAFGFMYPTCKAYAIREQPALYVSVTADLTFTERRGNPTVNVTVSNVATISKNDGVPDDPATASELLSLYNQNANQIQSASSLDRSIFMRILNLDSTAQAIGRNVGGVINVCNASNHLIFEANDEDITKNPWDAVEKRPEGIYTTLPGQVFAGDRKYGGGQIPGTVQVSNALNRHPRKCPANAEGDRGNCNPNSWWYMDKRENYGNGCGQLGLDPAYLQSTYNQQVTCRSALQTCVPGLNQVYLGEQMYGFEDRLSDRINGTNTERELRDTMQVQTPCQVSGHLLDIEELTKQEDIAARLNTARNRVNPLPPNWVELEGGEGTEGSGFSNPKYALHGTNLLYYGGFNRASGTNYVRVEIVIAGNVMSATETVSPGRFVRGTGQSDDTDAPACGLVVDGTGSYSVLVQNTGTSVSSYRVSGACNDPSLLVSTVEVPSMRAAEERRINVRVDNVQTDDSRVSSTSVTLPVCTLDLKHPVYDLAFDTIKTSCNVLDSDGEIIFVPNPLSGCPSWDSPTCSNDLREDIVEDTSSINFVLIMALSAIALMLGITISLILCQVCFVESLADENRQKRAAMQAAVASVKANRIASLS